MSDLFNGAIMTIFAREILEGTVIIGQYRTVLLRSDDWQDPERQKTGLRAITTSALLAALVAIIVTACVAIPLAVLSRELDETAATIIEGVSKIVAAICILQLSLKIPKFLGVYASKKDTDGVTIGLSLKSIRFNVAWNIWREIAEIGVFLIPFMLTGEGAKAIPLSGIAGIAVGALLGGLIYIANKRCKNKFWLAAFMAILLLLLSTGLFVGGCHEFEEVLGETPKIYNFGVVVVSEEEKAAEEAEEGAAEDAVTEEEVTEDTEEAEAHSEEGEEEHAASEDSPEYTGWSEKRLPMAVFKPFGYSAGPTQLMTACFWLWLVFGIFLHAWKYMSSKKILQAEEDANAERIGAKTVEEPMETADMDGDDAIKKDEASTDEENNSR